jgi:hypothetical protein
MQPLNPPPGVPFQRTIASLQLRPVFPTVGLPQCRQQHAGTHRNDWLPAPPQFAMFPCRREYPDSRWVRQKRGTHGPLPRCA